MRWYSRSAASAFSRRSRSMAAALSLASLPASRSARAAARSWSLASVAALLRGAASSSKYLVRYSEIYSEI